jgi:uncharacterized protein YybS (DUF2232 family)
VAAPFFKGRQTGYREEYTGLLIMAAILFIPSLLPVNIGWLSTLIPLPVFYYHTRRGRKKGLILTRNAILLGALGALTIGSLPKFLFSLTLVPLGIVLSYSFLERRSPVVTGLNGFVILGFTWLLYWGTLAILYQSNPYHELLIQIDSGLVNGLMVYEKSAELAPETLESLRQAIKVLQDYIPKVLPALLVSVLLSITWMNLALGNVLLRKTIGELSPWPEYSRWKLPEPLVWLVVVSGIFSLMLPKPLNIIGLNGLIICSTLYFFQGLAIAASLLNRWSVPGLFRVFIYALIFIQTYGIIILSFLGLLDVWADFRKIGHAGKSRKDPV